MSRSPGPEEAAPAAAARVMGLDIGSVRLGVALSDPWGTIAQPWTVLAARRPDTLDTLAALARDYEVGEVVVGRPWSLEGAAGLAVAAVEKFVEILRPRLALPIIWWDERLSSKAAERALIDAGMRRDKRRQTVDKVAAAWILQGFLDARARGVGAAAAEEARG